MVLVQCHSKHDPRIHGIYIYRFSFLFFLVGNPPVVGIYLFAIFFDNEFLTMKIFPMGLFSHNFQGEMLATLGKAIKAPGCQALHHKTIGYVVYMLVFKCI